MGRVLATLAVAALVSSGAYAADAGDQKELEEQIRSLQRQLVEAIGRGEEATELRGTLRDVRDARKADDWPKVKELVSAAMKAVPGNAGGGGPAAAGAGGAAGALPERVATTSGDISISLLVWKPADTKKAVPGVVLVADGFRGVRRVYRDLAAFIASKGYVVVVPELRGQGRSGGKVEFLGGEVNDIAMAVAWLKEQTYADANRIMMVGVGWGGSAALLSVGRGLSVVKGTASVAAPTDLNGLLKAKPGLRVALRAKGVSISPKDVVGLRAKSPMYGSTSFAGECLLIYGKADSSLPVRQSTGYGSVLTGRGVKVTHQAYNSMGAGFAEKKVAVYRADLLKFLDRLAGLRQKSKRRTGGRGRRR